MAQKWLLYCLLVSSISCLGSQDSGGSLKEGPQKQGDHAVVYRYYDNSVTDLLIGEYDLKQHMLPGSKLLSLKEWGYYPRVFLENVRGHWRRVRDSKKLTHLQLEFDAQARKASLRASKQRLQARSDGQEL